MASREKRRKKERRDMPNILVAGTPGTGKSTTCKRLASRVSELTWVEVGKLAKEKGFLGEWDEKYSCHVLEEDKLLDELEPMIAKGGVLVDHHLTDFYPERFFDIVFVLRTDNTALYDRLKERGYEGKKLDDNVQCEIFQTILDEARESYPEEIVHQLRSDKKEDVDANVARIEEWIAMWKKDNAET